MLNSKDAMLAHLATLGIEQRTVSHPPVFTVDEAQAHTHHLPGGHCKNLFLKDKKDRLWLVTCLDDQRVDLNRLVEASGCRAVLLRQGRAPAGGSGREPGQRHAAGDRQRHRLRA